MRSIIRGVVHNKRVLSEAWASKTLTASITANSFKFPSSSLSNTFSSASAATALASPSSSSSSSSISHSYRPSNSQEDGKMIYHQSTDPLMVIAAPGSRVLELSRPDRGNILTRQLTSILSKKLVSLETNTAVNIVFIASRSPDMFSLGFGSHSSKADAIEKMTSLNKLALTLKKFKKPAVSVIGGQISGSAFGALMGAKVC